MDSGIYDYIIIGAGAAGLHLAMAFIEDPAFHKNRILILEKDQKDSNDRTWSYWEQGAGRWDHLAYHIWKRGRFADQSTDIHLDMGGYQYKSIRSAAFYAHAKERIDKASNIDWIKAEVSGTRETKPVTVETANGVFRGMHVFDSRVGEAALKKDGKFTHVIQHFKGWIIQADRDAFDPGEFVMMDFRLKWQDTTSFMYVLPTSRRNALLEFTFFSPGLVDDSVYEAQNRLYIDEYLGLESYKILEVEKGLIPMTDYPFQRDHRPGITKIGTAGGWVKPSTGYSFKNAEVFSRRMLKNLKDGLHPAKGVATGRHRRYDILFLDLLNRRNEIGPDLFSAMYRNLPAHLIFKFLDEKTTLPEEIRIVSAFRPWPFLGALARKIGAVMRGA